MGTWHNSSSNSLVNGDILSFLIEFYIYIFFYASFYLKDDLKDLVTWLLIFFPSLFNKQPFITIIPITSDMNSVY